MGRPVAMGSNPTIGQPDCGPEILIPTRGRPRGATAADHCVANKYRPSARAPIDA